MNNSAHHGVVAVIRRDEQFLIIRRAAHILAGGYWCFVGGAVEPDESQAHAVVREVREEIGVAARAVRPLWRWTRPDGKLILDWWEVDLIDSHISCNPAEVETYRWLTAEQIRSLENVLESNLEFLRIHAQDAAATGIVEATAGPGSSA